jgi:hypothetical protein
MGNDQRSFEHRTVSQLVLVPKGAPKPTKFAGGNEEIFAGAVYIESRYVLRPAAAVKRNFQHVFEIKKVRSPPHTGHLMRANLRRGLPQSR